MAAKRRTKSKPRPAPRRGFSLRSEAIGSALVVLAILTLLSLLSPNRGNLTGALIQGLQVVFGIGVWLMPAVFAALGFWLVLRKVAEQPAILQGPRIVAFCGLFLVLEGSAHLWTQTPDPWALAAEGGGGGLTGAAVSQALVVALGLPVAVGMLALAALLALGALAGLTLADLETAAAAVRDWFSSLARTSEEAVPVALPLPFDQPEPVEPVWQRWWRALSRTLASPSWFGSPRGEPAVPVASPPLVVTPSRPAPTRAGRPEPAEQAANGRAPNGHNGHPANDEPPVAAPPQPEPAPRIIGGSGQPWRLPVLADILEDNMDQDIQGDDLRQRAQIIEKTLEGFGVPVQVVEANQGPAVTQFGLRPGTIVRRNKKGEEKRIKVRVSQIQALANDLALALSASPIRIEAPVPGRDVVGVEVPNVQISLVSLRGVMESEEYTNTHGTLLYGLGRDVSGQAAVADLTRMPHLLIAGATGSGKSVCVNAIITALLLTHTPETLRFLMVDPKRVELTVYNGVPHLIAPVVVDVERAVPVLQWATKEMDRRYKQFANLSARNIETYNEKLAARGEQAMPYIVIVIDELADLMLSAPEDVERHICRIAQMARATGIHLVIATQRPSVDVVTGLIKANFPARIAFAVTSQVDSRVILDTPGAEQLLGRGDMLFMAPDASKLQRLQGCYVSDLETQRLVYYWRGVHALATGAGMSLLEDSEEGDAPHAADDEPGNTETAADPPWLPGQEALQQPLWSEMSEMEEEAGDRDGMYRQAEEEVRKAGRASVSLLQRRLRIGYSRAARLIDELETHGVIGPDQGGSRGRDVLPAARDGEKS